MSISPVSSSIGSGYDSTEMQKLKPKLGKEELNQKTGDITENAVVESKKIETKSELSSEDSSTVEISVYGDTVEISKQGMSKAQIMSSAPYSASAKQSASSVSATSAQAALLKPSNTADTASSTTSSTAYLSNDSDYELKQKLEKGIITQSQYDTEIKKRGKDPESSEIDYSTNQNTL